MARSDNGELRNRRNHRVVCHCKQMRGSVKSNQHIGIAANMRSGAATGIYQAGEKSGAAWRK